VYSSRNQKAFETGHLRRGSSAINAVLMLEGNGVKVQGL